MAHEGGFAIWREVRPDELGGAALPRTPQPSLKPGDKYPISGGKTLKAPLLIAFTQKRGKLTVAHDVAIV